MCLGERNNFSECQEVLGSFVSVAIKNATERLFFMFLLWHGCMTTSMGSRCFANLISWTLHLHDAHAVVLRVIDQTPNLRQLDLWSASLSSSESEMTLSSVPDLNHFAVYLLLRTTRCLSFPQAHTPRYCSPSKLMLPPLVSNWNDSPCR